MYIYIYRKLQIGQEYNIFFVNGTAFVIQVPYCYFPTFYLFYYPNLYIIFHSILNL